LLLYPHMLLNMRSMYVQCHIHDMVHDIVHDIVLDIVHNVM